MSRYRVGKGGKYRSSPHTTLLKLLEGGGRSLGSLDELELGLRAVGALRLGHLGGDVPSPRGCSRGITNRLGSKGWFLVLLLGGGGGQVGGGRERKNASSLTAA